MKREHRTIDRETAALILVDIQPDFLPGGRLAVADGDRILAPVRRLMEADLFGVQVATQDWHPTGHVSFASSHPGHDPMDVIQLYGHDQVLWPDHCVQGTPGAALAPDLPWERVSAIVRKGTDPQCDSYSGFRNNWNPAGERPATGLAGYLRDRGVSNVYLCGLARDYCVKWSAEDGAGEGFLTHVVWDLTRPVDPGADETVRRDLRERGVEVLSLEMLPI